MNWYYVENGHQAGPVTEEQLGQLRAAGRVLDGTLVWREGMPDWKPWREATGVPPIAGGAVCAGCGQTFKPEEVIRVNDRFVCAACKPAYLQRVREGLGGAGGGGPGRTTGEASLQTVEDRDYEHDLGEYLSKAWEFFKNDPGIIIGVSVLVYVCVMAASFIPFGVGLVLQYVLSGPLFGGLWVFYLRKMRGEQPGVGEGFSGFGPRFGQLLAAYVIPVITAMLCMLPGVIPLFIGLILPMIQHPAVSPFEGGASIPMIVIGGCLLIVGWCFAIYFTVCWMFSLALVADKGMNFWPAMRLSRHVVIKHWWMTLLIVIVLGIVSSLGVIGCLIGVLVTAPMAFAAKAYAYEKLFGDMAQQG